MRHDSSSSTLDPLAVTGWSALGVLLVLVLGFGLAVAGGPDTDAADLAADLARAGRLLGIDRAGVVVAEIEADPQRLVEAGELLDAVVERAPGSAAARRLRALHRLGVGQLAAARADAQRAVELAPDGVEHRLVLGAIEAQARDFVAAESTFRRATETWPGSVEAWHGLGQVLFLLGREDEAVAAYRRKLAASAASRADAEVGDSP